MIKNKQLSLMWTHIVFIFILSWALPQVLHAQEQSAAIYGTVATETGRGIDGVLIAFNNGEVTEYATTSGGGHYSHDVYIEWSGTVTPSHECYSFTPVSVTLGTILADTEQNFTASYHMLTISGVISDGPPVYAGETLTNPLYGVVLTLSTGGSTMSGIDGSYSFSVGCGWTGSITPMKVGWQFTPLARTYEEPFYEDLTGENFVGTVSSTEYTISGRVTDESGRTGMDGVTITFFDGNSLHDEFTAGGGYYSYSVPAFWTGTITPTFTGYSFTPPFSAVGPVQANLTRDFTASSATYVISGIVMREDFTPISNVTVSLSTGSTITTGNSGIYSFTVGHGWSGAVIPSRAGWVFEPRRRTYNNLGADHLSEHFVGYQGSNRVTIAGSVTQSDGSGIPGVILAFTGSGTTTTDDNGEYSKLVLFGWSGTVTPEKTGYTFSPTNRTYTSVKTNLADQDYIYYGTPPAPVISLAPKQLYFAAEVSGSAGGSQSFSVMNSGGGILNWTAASEQTWIQFTPASGIDSGTVAVSVDPSGLAAGMYNGAITVSDPNASNSPQTVAVQLKILNPADSEPPFGAFDTPTNNSKVRSSIPVTGWALDDIGVESVKIYREDNGSLVFIGDAVFVEGARPDVELLYPDYPNNKRGGWGYMMLTNFLPNGGNGVYTFQAVARDVEGNETVLGSKTVTCDNANAVKPFGAIDAPPQGGTASGVSYRNAGWVLTPLPNKIPEDGSTIDVYVDGINLGHPTYNIYREDVAVLFPGYANSNGAHAYFDLNTTVFDSGLHTIQWIAVDDAGNTDGIGSRFFTIMNPSVGSSIQSKSTPAFSGNLLRKFRDAGAADFLPGYGSPISIKTGFNRLEGARDASPDKNGVIRIEAKVLERVEIHLGSAAAGFQVVGNENRALPPGSRLDLETGIFYWMPGPAFLGEYKLLFIREDAEGRFSGVTIIVNLTL